MYVALIVEDDADLAEITAAHLIHSGYQVDMAYTCAQAEEMLSKREYDLILLDEVLPDRSGDELCRTIRTKCACPIIFMSCLDDSDTIISALRSGGDDYMVKPVNYAELLARADAVIRRSSGRKRELSGHMRTFRQFTIDTARHRVLRGEREIELSSIEYALLLFMNRAPGHLAALSRYLPPCMGQRQLGRRAHRDGAHLQSEKKTGPGQDRDHQHCAQRGLHLLRRVRKGVRLWISTPCSLRKTGGSPMRAMRRIPPSFSPVWIFSSPLTLNG